MKQGKEYEERLNDFINTLNDEKKPILSKGEEKDLYMVELLETVKAVKRQKQTTKNQIKVFQHKKSHSKKTIKWLRAVAACLTIMLISGSLLLMNQGHNKVNVVYAMEKAFEKLNSYSGTLHYFIESNGEKEIETTIDVTYVAPNLFRAEHHIGDRTVTKIYNGGDRMYTINDNEQVVDAMSPEMETIALEYYHLGETVEVIKNNITKLSKTGVDQIAGRDVDVYEYTNKAVPVTYTVCLDQVLHLPLKLVVAFKDGFKTVSYFTDITFNPVVDEDIFDYALDPTKPIVDQSDVPSNEPRTSDQTTLESVLAFYLDEAHKITWINAEFYNYDQLTYKDQALEVLDNLREHKHRLVTVNLNWHKEDQPVIERINDLGDAIVDLEYVGFADHNFAEFILDGRPVTFGIEEQVKEQIQNLTSNEGIQVIIATRSWSGVPVVTEILK